MPAAAHAGRVRSARTQRRVRAAADARRGCRRSCDALLTRVQFDGWRRQRAAWRAVGGAASAWPRPRQALQSGAAAALRCAAARSRGGSVRAAAVRRGLRPSARESTTRAPSGRWSEPWPRRPAEQWRVRQHAATSSIKPRRRWIRAVRRPAGWIKRRLAEWRRRWWQSGEWWTARRRSWRQGRQAWRQEWSRRFQHASCDERLVNKVEYTVRCALDRGMF